MGQTDRPTDNIDNGNNRDSSDGHSSESKRSDGDSCFSGSHYSDSSDSDSHESDSRNSEITFMRKKPSEKSWQSQFFGGFIPFDW